MRYWLMKSEPLSYGIDDLKAVPGKTTCWDGVRNYQARNMIRDEMSQGDLAFFYHSNCGIPGIVGIMKIVKEAYPDYTAFDPENEHYDSKSDFTNPHWFMVDVKFVKKFTHIITLEALRRNPILKDMVILRRGNRLSITPVTIEQWHAILC